MALAARHVQKDHVARCRHLFCRGGPFTSGKCLAGEKMLTSGHKADPEHGFCSIRHETATIEFAAEEGGWVGFHGNGGLGYRLLTS